MGTTEVLLHDSERAAPGGHGNAAPLVDPLRVPRERLRLRRGQKSYVSTKSVLIRCQLLATKNSIVKKVSEFAKYLYEFGVRGITEVASPQAVNRKCVILGEEADEVS